MLKKRKITSIYNLIDDYDEMQYKLQRDGRQSTKNNMFSIALSLGLFFIYWAFCKHTDMYVNIIIFSIILIFTNILTYNYFSIYGMNKILKEIKEKYNLKQEKTSINGVINNFGSQNFKIKKLFKYLDYNTVNSIFYFKMCLIYEKIDDKNLEILHKELEEIRTEERKKKTTSLVSFLKNNGVQVIVSLLFAAIINNYYSSLFNNFIELKKNSGYISNMHEIFWQHILFILLILCFLIVIYFFISLSVPDSKKIEMDKLKIINEALYHLKEGLEVNKKMTTFNISIKTDEKTKKEAQKLFKDLGLNLSTAINIFLKQAIKEKGIPFYINSLPENSELDQAFKEVRQIKKNPSNYKSYSSSKEMFKDVLGEKKEKYKYSIILTRKFKKHLKTLKKQKKDLNLLKNVISTLAKREKLPPKNKDRKLVNNYDGARECHITPDWLLIYEIVEDKLILILLASGSHSELF